MTTAGEFLSALGRSSLQAGLLILLVLLVQRVFRKQLSPRWRCALWLLVMIRLIPFSFSSAISIFNLVPGWRDAEPTAPAEITVVDTSRFDRPETGVAGGGTRFDPVAIGDVTVDRGGDHSRPAVRVDQPVGPVEWGRIVLWLWLGGVAVLGIHVGILSIRTVRRFATLKPLDAPCAVTLLRECCAQLGVPRVPGMVESELVGTPALYGLVRPRLVLPVGFTTRFSASEQRYVFLHELAHLKRHDLLANWFVTGLQILHWFNPLVWLGFACWRLDREMACDAHVLETTGAGQNREYGRTMLRLFECLVQRTTVPSLVGILEHKRQLGRRLRMIAGFTPAPRWSIAGLLVLGVLAAIGLTDAQDAGSKPNGPDLTEDATRAAPEPGLPVEGKPADPGLRHLTVAVLDAETEQPLADAEVTAWALRDSLHPKRSSTFRFTTDAVGEAHLAVARSRNAGQEQTFAVGITRVGYAPRQLTFISAAGNVRATLGDRRTVHLHRGSTIGGFVRDTQGSPIAGARVTLFGSNYQGFRLGSGIKAVQEFSEFRVMDENAIRTDERGYWSLEDYPTDLDALTISVLRPGGARAEFATPAQRHSPSDRTKKIRIEDLRSREAVLALADGSTIRGRVTDLRGEPVAGVELRARDKLGRGAFHVFSNQADGRFELLHWDVTRLILTAVHPDFATKSVVVTPSAENGDIVLALKPAVPLRIRAVDGDGKPVVADLRIVDHRSGDQLLDWRGTTDETGAAVWPNAPDEPVTLGIVAPDLPGRTINLQADDTEHVVRLRRDADKSVVVRLRVVDSATGRPIDRFEVWRATQGPPYQLCENPGSNGDHRMNVLATEFRNGIERVYRVQIRARGYGNWTSDSIDFSDGDPLLEVRMNKGVAADSGPARNNERIAVSSADEPALLTIGELVRQLLETGDTATFARDAGPSEADWDALLSQDGQPRDDASRKNAGRQVERARTVLTDCGQQILDFGKRFGFEPRKVRFRVETVTARTRGTSSSRAAKGVFVGPSLGR